MNGKLRRERNHSAEETREFPRCYYVWLRYLWSALLLCSLITISVPVFGHHGGAAWDAKTTLMLQGTITEFRFINPHIQIFLDAKDEKGNVIHWACEGADPAMLVRQGWSRDTLKPGDRVTVVGRPAKSGAKLVELQKLTLANGQVLEAKGTAQ